MIEGYSTISETAKRWGVTVRQVQYLCSNGKVKGAVKFGRAWAIPVDAEKPIDNRVTTGEYKDWRKKSTDKV